MKKKLSEVKGVVVKGHLSTKKYILYFNLAHKNNMKQNLKPRRTRQKVAYEKYCASTVSRKETSRYANLCGAQGDFLHSGYF